MKIFKIIPLLIFIIIVIFQNFDKETSIWDLIYYSHNYLMAFGFIYIGFKVESNVLAQSLLIALGLYFFFELSMDLLAVFNEPLKDELYTTRNINYVVAGSLGISLFIWPIFLRLKKCLHLNN